ncbi:MAG: PKD domain-containing protein [Owenweeksia sp.]|nr:PKD domain-containing protein [Owenweeksia sp.]
MDSVTYQISLVITDGNGCLDSLSKLFTVYPKPQAGFIISNRDSCGPLSLRFTNSSVPNISGQGRGSMTFQWDFGNGQTSQDSMPSQTFTNTGVEDSVYVVNLIATNGLGCSDTLTDSVVVRPDPLAVMDTSTTFGCTPFTINDSVVVAEAYPQANSSYQWTVLDKNSGSVLHTATGPNAINYTMTAPADTVLVRLVTQSHFGCKARYGPATFPNDP